MSIVQKPTRYAHSDGHTDVCYSTDGLKLITCGTDGDVRIWSGFDDDDPVQTCIGEWSHCVKQKDEFLYAATDSNNVQLLTYPNGERDRILISFTSHVNHMAIGKDHNVISIIKKKGSRNFFSYYSLLLIGIAVEDLNIKVINLDGTATHNFIGVTGPPLSIALCPKAKYVAVTSGDGYLRIWNVETQELLKEIECVPKVNSFKYATLLCRIDFHPLTGTNLAYPFENTVIILNIYNWTKILTLKCNSINSSISIVQYSPCGNYLAASTEKGELIVWEISTQNVIGVTKHVHEIALTSITWNPLGNKEIAFCDVQGQLGIATVTGAVETNSENSETAFNSEEQLQSEDENDDNTVSIEELKKEVIGLFDNKEQESDVAESATSYRSPSPEPFLQNTFMPTSTPEHLNPRYLCWNEIGVIRCYGNVNDESEDRFCSIETEFHDSEFHSSMMMQNYQSYTMGSLSTRALVVANSSQLAVKPLAAGTKDWTVTIDEGETIICAANSEFLVCFATSNCLVRIYSIYGTQKTVFSIPGPLVSMAAYSHYLLLAYHYSPPNKNGHCIRMMLVKLKGINIESRDVASALNFDSTLQWLGFTDVGSPAMQDSLGILYIYPLQSNVWIPFCDTSKLLNGKSDGFFVTAVCESLQTINGICCRGSIYPSFTPRPTLSEFVLRPLFANLHTEKSQLESDLFTWSILKVNDTDKKYKQTSLKLFALACKSNLDHRALELIELLTNPQVLSLAVKYASKMDKKRLSEKLMELTSAADNDLDKNVLLHTSKFDTDNDVRCMRRKFSAATRTTTKVTPQVTPIKTTENVLSPSIELNASISTPQNSNDTSSYLQESSVSKTSGKNPFLKSLMKRKERNLNPLSLTDKFAGYDIQSEKKNDCSVEQESGEKRKQPEHYGEQQKEKQRKLDRFMFTKET